MIDPKTLKYGDTVVIAGVEFTINSTAHRYGAWLKSRPGAGLAGDVYADFNSDIWCVAELKKKPLPDTLWFQGFYFGCIDKYNPVEALREAREIVRLLEEAGVK